MKELHLSEIETERKVDQVAENLFAIVTEDDHLILECDLNNQTGWTDARHRRFCATGTAKIRIVTEIGSVLLPDYVINLTVYQFRTCEHCGIRMTAKERSSHPGFEVHDHCWPDFVAQNPDLFPETEGDDEYA